MRTNTKFMSILGVSAAVFLAAGCAQRQERVYEPEPATVYKPQPAPAQTAAPAPAPTATYSCKDATWGPVKLEKSMPAEAAMGSEFAAELKVTAQACVGNVVVRDEVPANASYVRSEPAARADGKQLYWDLGNMESGESKTLKVWLKADAEGTLVNCATVSADPRTCASTRVVRPAIQLTKTQPAEVTICDPIPVVLTVKNNGSSKLTNVKVSDNLPSGLTSDGKSSLTFDVGNLNPGESKEFRFNAVAANPGRYVNPANVTTAQGVKADASASTVVRQPVLAISCTAPDQRYMGRPFDVCFNVVNKGDTAAAGTVVEVAVPAGLTARSATAGGQIGGGKVSWNLGALGANAPKELCVNFVGDNAGTYAFNATAKGSCAKQVSTTCQTRVVGISALLLEKADNPDPIAIGESTTYTVKVTNQGTADDTNVKMVVEFPAEVTPVSASNGGTVSGKTVTFPAYPRLAPKAAFTYTIQAKGEKVGDARIRFIRTSDGIPAPTTAEESTRVY